VKRSVSRMPYDPSGSNRNIKRRRRMWRKLLRLWSSGLWRRLSFFFVLWRFHCLDIKNESLWLWRIWRIVASFWRNLLLSLLSDTSGFVHVGRPPWREDESVICHNQQYMSSVFTVLLVDILCKSVNCLEPGSLWTPTIYSFICNSGGTQ
jgi:hypothetical protein